MTDFFPLEFRSAILVVFLHLGHAGLGVATASEQSSTDDRDRIAFLEVLDSKYATIKGMYCEFEGEETYLEERAVKSANLDANHTYDRFTGSIHWRSDGFSRLELFHCIAPQKNVSREILVVKGGESEIYTNPEDPKVGAGYIQDSRLQNLERSGSYGLFFLADALRGLFKNPNVHFKHEGVGDVDGNRCEVVAFSFPNAGSPFQRFWLDMIRGGHSLKREVYDSEGHVQTRTTVRLRKFRSGSRRGSSEIWLPASGDHGVYSFFDSSSERSVYLDLPWTSTHLDVVPTTVECNLDLADSNFSMKYRSGTPISDALRGVRLEYGQQRVGRKRITRREAEDLLQKQLKATADQREELLEHSSYDEPSSAFNWVLLGSGVGAIALGVVLFFLKRS